MTLLTGQSCPEFQPHWKLDVSQLAGWDCGHAETLSGGVPAPPGPGCGAQTPHSSLATCDAEHRLRWSHTDSRVSFAPSADGSIPVAQPPGASTPSQIDQFSWVLWATDTPQQSGNILDGQQKQRSVILYRTYLITKCAGRNKLS